MTIKELLSKLDTLQAVNDVNYYYDDYIKTYDVMFNNSDNREYILPDLVNEILRYTFINGKRKSFTTTVLKIGKYIVKVTFAEYNIEDI